MIDWMMWSASDAFYVTDNAEAANAWRLTNSHIETLDPTNQRSITSQSAYDPAPVYNCFLRGLVTNIVPHNGTVYGSNIQNDNYKSLTLSTYSNYEFTTKQLTRWDDMVKSYQIPDKIFFTSQPLESLIEIPENAKAEQVKQIESQNNLITLDNNLLLLNAKTLKDILIEKTLETIPIK